MRKKKICAVLLLLILGISALSVGVVFSLQTAEDYYRDGTWVPSRSVEQSGNNEPVLIRYVKQQSDEIVIQYKMPEPVLNEVTYQNRDNQIFYRMGFGNNDLLSEPGKPEVPSLPARIVIPRGHVVESISIEPDDVVAMPGRYLLSYAEEPLPITCEPPEEPSTSPDESVYGSDDAYPPAAYEYHGIQYGMGIAVAHINLYPVEYRPFSGDLQYYGKFTLRVNMAQDANAGTDVRVDIGRFEDRFGSSVDNLGALETYMDGEIMGRYQNVIDPMQSYSYVFITSEAVANDESVDPTVDDLINHRVALGYTSTVVTTEYIYANYGGSNDFDRVRNFIKDAYNNWGTQFVTLGGDINIIPYTTVYATVGSTSDYIPTDLPLQCLDGDTWNEDFYAEVMIGRISGNNAGEISNQIHKILKYETDPQSESYFQTGLGVGEELDSNTYGKEAMLELQTYFSDDWSWDGLYDLDGTWNKQQVIDLINTNSFSVINHLGHSNWNYNMKMSNGDENSFTNTNYMFLKSQGCIAGDYERDCITERFTTQRRTGGMFAAVTNSRYGWYSPGNPTGGPSHQLHRSFWYGAWDLDMDYFSEFNEYSHRMHYTDWRWDVLTSNYFGCAATLFRGKEIPGEPPSVTVTRPDGGESFLAGELEDITWTSAAGDDPIDYVQLAYSVNGGTSWTVIATGLPDTGSYTWTVPNENSDQCLVRVRVFDVLGRTGEDVSDGLFTIQGTPPAPPDDISVEHIGTMEEWNWLYNEPHRTTPPGATGLGSAGTYWGAMRVELDADEAIGMACYVLHQPTYIVGYIHTDGAGGTTPGSRLGETEQIDNPGPGEWVEIPFQQPVDLTAGHHWIILEVQLPDGSTRGLGRYDGHVDDNAWISLDFSSWSELQDYDLIYNHALEVLTVDYDETGDDHNLVTWNASPDDPPEVSHYNIYRSELQGGPWDASTLIDSVSADGSTQYACTDPFKGLADEIYWWYVVRAVGTNGMEEQNTDAVQEPGAPTDTFDIPLYAGGDAEGWNFVSFNLIPVDTSLEAILADIGGNYDKLMYFDASSGEWSSYVPGRAERYNNLQSWNHRMGIWIHVTTTDTLTIVGTAPASTDLTLYPGWTMVSLPSETAGNHGLPGEIDRLGYFDGTAEYNLAYSFDPDTFVFEPGQGYWIHNPGDTAVVWTIDY